MLNTQILFLAMTRKMPPADAELYKRVDEIAHYIWDPIGVRDIAQARDEYHGYLPGLYGRVKAGDLDQIIDYMRWVVTENMGMSFDQSSAKNAARVMLDWKDKIEENM